MSSIDPVAREFSPVGIYPTPRPSFTQPTSTSASVPPPTDTPQSLTTTPSPSLPTDVAALHSIINTLQAELKATTSVNNNLAASVARLQAEFTDTIISVNNQFAASLARLQAEQAVPASASAATLAPATNHAPDTATIPLTTAPHSCSHSENPRTIASGRGAASPEVFQEMIKTNWHGRLGRTHMVDVDALPTTALTELDCLLRRKLHVIFPRGGGFSRPDTDTIFASLAVLGLRLENRVTYADLPVIHDPDTLRKTPTIKRGRNSAAWYTTKEKYADYWQGVPFETLVELARYRGLFDGEGYLKED